MTGPVITGGAVISTGCCDRPPPTASGETAVDVPAALLAVTRQWAPYGTPLREPAGVAETVSFAAGSSQPPGSQTSVPSPAFTIAGARVFTGAPAGAVVKNASFVTVSASRTK